MMTNVTLNAMNANTNNTPRGMTVGFGFRSMMGGGTCTISTQRVSMRDGSFCPAIYQGGLHRFVIRQDCRRPIRRHCRHRVTPLGFCLNFQLNCVGNLMMPAGRCRVPAMIRAMPIDMRRTEMLTRFGLAHAGL